MMKFAIYKKILIRIIHIFLYFVLLIVIYSIFVEPRLIRVNEQNLYLPNFQSEHNGMKIAVLSDLHIGGLCMDEWQLKRIVKKTNKQKPDFILLLGDVDSIRLSKSGIPSEKISEILSKFSSKYGVYSVLGNHDYKSNPSIPKILKAANVKVLDGSSCNIKLNNKNVILYGLKDFWHYDYDENLIKKDINSSIIVLSHNPDTFPFIPGYTALTLSGHTHGGQIYLPFLGGIFCSSMYAQRYIKGYVVENNKHIFITSGLGNCAPARFGNIPEIVILNLYSQDSYPNKKIINTKARKGITNTELLPMYFDLVRKIFHINVQY